MALSPAGLAAHLRARGITVHHAAPAADGSPEIVVFLEGALDQHEEAATHARRLPGVTGVTFVPQVKAIMIVRVG